MMFAYSSYNLLWTCVIGATRLRPWLPCAARCDLERAFLEKLREHAGPRAALPEDVFGALIPPLSPRSAGGWKLCHGLEEIRRHLAFAHTHKRTEMMASKRRSARRCSQTGRVTSL